MSCPRTSTASATSASSPAATGQQKLALCRRLLDMPPPEPSEPAPDYHALFEQLTGASLLQCPGLPPWVPVRGGALRAGRAPSAGGLLMITARWAQPPPLPKPSSRSQGHLRPSAPPQARLPAPSRPTQSPEPLRKRLSPRQYPPIPPSCAGRTAQQILGRPCNAHSQGSACGSVQTIF